MIALHAFPESSLIGDFISAPNELLLISEISSLLVSPLNINVFEHPTSFYTGERPLWVDHFYNSHPSINYFSMLTTTGIPFDVLKSSEYVISLSGGVVLEKALLGGTSYLCSISPALHVKNINILPIASNKWITPLIDPVNLSPSSYCSYVMEEGFKFSDISLVFTKIIFKYSS